MKTVKIQAREIFRVAKRNKIRMYGGSFGNCAVSIVGVMVGYTIDNYIAENPWTADHGERFYREIARRSGHTYEDLKALEAGYEDQSYIYPKTPYQKNRYLKVGERLSQFFGTRN